MISHVFFVIVIAASVGFALQVWFKLRAPALYFALGCVAGMAALAPALAYAGTAFFTHDEVSGLNRICYYDYLGSTVAKTIKAYEICPLTIEVPD